jgi:G2/mitotic-specific cyclin 2
VEGQLETAFDFLIEKLASPGFESQYAYRKYANKKFLKAAVFACEWAKRHVASRR